MEKSLGNKFFQLLGGALIFLVLAPSAPSQAKADKPGPDAKSIKEVTFSSQPEGVQVNIKGDGLIPDYTIMQMLSPARLVLDLPAMTNASQKKNIQVGHSTLEEIRIGQHAKKVRLVFEFPGEKIPRYQIAKKGQELILTFSKSKDQGSSLPEKRATPRALEPVKAEKPEPRVAPQKLEQLETKIPAREGERPPSPGEKPATQRQELPAEAKQIERAKTQVGQPPAAKISLDFKDADIRTVLQKIAELSKQRIITSERIQGNITLRLIDIPWDQALDIILENRNLVKIPEGNTLWIVTRQEFEQRKR